MGTLVLKINEVKEVERKKGVKSENKSVYEEVIKNTFDYRAD